MKHVLLFLLAAVVLAGCGKDTSFSKNVSALDIKDEDKIYPFKSAIIKYTFEGRGMEGTRIIYIDQWGTMQAEHMSKELRNNDLAEEWIIKRGSHVYTIDLEENVAVKSLEVNRHAETIDLDELAKIHGGDDNALAWLDSQGIHLLGTEDIGGYSCQVVEYEQESLIRRCWIYQGVALKIIKYIGGELTHVHDESFTDIQFDVSVDPGCFKLPKGVKITVEP